MNSQHLSVMPVNTLSQRIWTSPPLDATTAQSAQFASVGSFTPTINNNIPTIRDIASKLNLIEGGQERGLMAGLQRAQSGQNQSTASTMLRLQVDLVMYQTWHQIVTKTVESVNTSMKTLMNAA